jgi:hypothetical protein
MLVNEVIVEKVAGDICTFKLPLESFIRSIVYLNVFLS